MCNVSTLALIGCQKAKHSLGYDRYSIQGDKYVSSWIYTSQGHHVLYLSDG